MLAEPRRVEEGAYLLEQRFRYAYASPVRSLRHRLVVVPPAIHGGQYRRGHGLTVTGARAVVVEQGDAFGNHVFQVRAAEVEAWIELEAWALVARPGPGAVTALPGTALRDPRLLTATRLTEPDGVLAEAGREIAAAAAGRLDLAERACSWAHQAIAYEFGVTGVRTTAAEAVAGGRGVCQDHAHVMLALCRGADLAARYVSGHLVGEGGSHAWVEVVVPDPADPGRAVAVAYDPTHDRRAGRAYLTVAVGRDYADVAPTAGTFEGAGPGVLSASKRLGPVADDARAAS